MIKKNNTLFNTISTKQFLQKYWQKKPLLIQDAFPHFKSFLNKEKLIKLSCNHDIQSRLIRLQNQQWTLDVGPFKKKNFAQLKGHWTLLVQGLNYFLPEAESLLKAFNFIPHARLDDLMVSVAPDGGGVGPHFDSYDVFLLQGQGQRLWQISKQKNQAFIPDAPLRILKNFKAEQEWVLNPGDMLYLPPRYAHNGIAQGESITYSIGFRAVSFQEITQAFLMFLQDQLQLSGRYTDPDLKLLKHPAEISKQMVTKIEKIIKKIHFNKNDIEKFIGCYLSEPKAQLTFDPPHPAMEKKQFLKLAFEKGIMLDLKSQILFTHKQFFVNGETFPCSAAVKPYLKKLADERELMPSYQVIQKIGSFIYEWYLNGYLWIKTWKK